MKTYGIEKQINELHEAYRIEVRDGFKTMLDAMESERYDEQILKQQMGFLLGKINSHAATWSGGADSVKNALETITRNVAINLLDDLNRGF